MKTLKKILLVDAVVQSLMVCFMLLCIISTPFFKNGGIVYAMLALIPFGIWQVLSGAVIGLGYNESQRKHYLLTVVIYFIITGITTSLLRSSAGIFGGIFPFMWFILPVGIGIWYYARTIKDFGRVNNRARSFWDLV